jgi:hypothetical protein
MTVDHDALRARVAELIPAGVLPAKPDLVAEVSIGASDAVCLACAAAGAQVAYRCWDGRRFALPASCAALWDLTGSAP